MNCPISDRTAVITLSIGFTYPDSGRLWYIEYTSPCSRISVKLSASANTFSLIRLYDTVPLSFITLCSLITIIWYLFA